ncbi:transmembrane protein 184C-like, partial [Anneissia japonica]|uniref:transmembrane protein 184C-like n=1 Tax=Anneissia japonica TaxID=1529436 RepID=UPI001425ACF4
IIRRCKHGVLNYTVLRPITTIIALICELTEHYNEGSFAFEGAWSYLLIINNVSQVWALYCMILFYHATKDELEPIKPLSKFLCIKLTIFASFWQSVFVNILVDTGAIQPKESWGMDKYDFGKAIQDFLICIEMFLAAIAHYYSFSYKPYQNDGPRSRFFSNFKKMWDMSDVRKDITEHVTVVGNDFKRKVGNMVGMANDSEADVSTVVDDNDIQVSVKKSRRFFKKRKRLVDDISNSPAGTSPTTPKIVDDDNSQEIYPVVLPSRIDTDLETDETPEGAITNHGFLNPHYSEIEDQEMTKAEFIDQSDS